MKIKNHLHNHWPIIFICILGAIPPLIWFKDGLLIAGGDNYYYLDPGTSFKYYLYTWLAKIAAGAPNTSVSQVFPMMFFWAVLKGAGLSLVTIERLWAVLLSVVPGLSIYYLVTHLYTKKDHKLAGFIAAVLYMFNVYVMMDVLQPNFRLVQAALPITLLFWIKGLNSRIFSLKYPILIGIVSIFYASSNINIPTVSIIPLVLSLYLIFFMAMQKDRLLHTLKFSIATAFIYVLVNFWWISSSFVSMVEASLPVQAAVSGVNFTGSTKILEAFRLMGFWAFRSVFLGMPHFPYAGEYYEPFLLAITYLIPLITFVILLKDSKDQNINFFALLAISGLFFTKGVNEPIGSAYKFFYENVPGFWIFREPFSKFTPLTLFSYSVLLGYSVEAIYRKVHKWASSKRRRVLTPLPMLIPISAVLIVLVSAFPIITGEAIQDVSWYGDPKFSLHVDVPDYWYEAAKWLDENEDDRVLILPAAGYGHCYRWESGMCSAGPVSYVFLSSSLIAYTSTPTSNSAKFIGRLFDFVGPNSSTNIAPFLALFDVKYVLQQNDLDWEYGLLFNPRSPKEMKAFLTSQPGIVYNRSFGRLDLYQVKDEYLLPRIYVPEEVTYASGGDVLTGMIAFPDFEIRNAIFTEERLDGAQRRSVLRDATTIFVEASPADYFGEELNYTFEIPKESPYGLYLKTSRAKEVDPKGITVQLDGKEASVKEEMQQPDEARSDLGDGYTPLGRLNLTKGVHHLTISLPHHLTTLNLAGWTLIADDGNVALYETFLPESFPEDLDTSPEKQELIRVYRDGVLLKEGGFGEPLLEVDEITIGEIRPRRVAVSVPSGTEPTGNYSISYASPSPIFIRAENPTAQASKPLITYDKIDPTSYRIQVKHAAAPYYLVFSESYHPKWKAYIGNREITENNHLLANGYSNAWYIDKAGDYDIILEHTPQRFLKVGLAILGITLISSLLYLFRRRGPISSGEVSPEIEHDRKISSSVSLFQKNINIHLLSKIFVILFMVLLSVSVVLLASDQATTAESLGVWAYLSLSVGVLLQFGLLLRGR